MLRPQSWEMFIFTIKNEWMAWARKRSGWANQHHNTFQIDTFKFHHKITLGLPFCEPMSNIPDPADSLLFSLLRCISQFKYSLSIWYIRDLCFQAFSLFLWKILVGEVYFWIHILMSSIFFYCEAKFSVEAASLIIILRVNICLSATLLLIAEFFWLKQE